MSSTKPRYIKTVIPDSRESYPACRREWRV